MNQASIPIAADLGLASCHTCGKTSPVDLVHCPRCHSRLHLRKPDSLARTWSFLIAAIAFYVPAMSLPVMNVSGVGGGEASTILSGVVTFWKMGWPFYWPVSVVVRSRAVS